MTYGGTVPTPSYTISGFVNGDASAVVSGTPTLNPGATSSSPVGSYVTTIALGTLSATNYDFPNLVSGILTVNQVPLTVTADNKTKPLGSPNPPLTDTISGFVNGDTSAIVSGAASLSTTATTSSPAGVYPILVTAGTLTATNYDFPTFVNGTLTVVPQTGPTVTVTPSINPSVFGQAVTFAVKVSQASTGPVPTGSVQFQADGTNFGSAVSLVNGAATSPPIMPWEWAATRSSRSTRETRFTLAAPVRRVRRSTRPQPRRRSSRRPTPRYWVNRSASPSQ